MSTASGRAAKKQVGHFHNHSQQGAQQFAGVQRKPATWRRRQPKGAQADGSKACISAAAALFEWLRKQEELRLEASEEGNKEAAPSPFSEGRSRQLLSAALLCAKAHDASALMAWFIMHNEGRLIFSHDSSHAPLGVFVGSAMHSRVDQVGQSLFVVSEALLGCRGRPWPLHDACLCDFVMRCKVTPAQAHNQHKQPRADNTFFASLQSMQHLSRG